MNFKILFFATSVQTLIEKWPVGMYASFVRIPEQMAASGPNLGMPYTKAMGEGLFEIRARSSEGIGRACFCCMKGKRIVILHGFVKKTQATPIKELRLAKQRMKEVLSD
jgi:phage-related protein